MRPAAAADFTDALLLDAGADDGDDDGDSTERAVGEGGLFNNVQRWMQQLQFPARVRQHSCVTNCVERWLSTPACKAVTVSVP